MSISNIKNRVCEKKCLFRMKFIEVLSVISLFYLCTTHNLYHSSISTQRSYYDCIYVRSALYTASDDQQINYLNAWSLIPYCRRPTNPLEREESSCQGQLVSFFQLREEKSNKQGFVRLACIDRYFK